MAVAKMALCELPPEMVARNANVPALPADDFEFMEIVDKSPPGGRTSPVAATFRRVPSARVMYMPCAVPALVVIGLTKAITPSGPSANVAKIKPGIGFGIVLKVPLPVRPALAGQPAAKFPPWGRLAAFGSIRSSRCLQ